MYFDAERQGVLAPVREKVKKWNSEKVLVVLLALVFVVSACRKETSQPVKPVETRQVTDDLGRTVTLPARVTRAVSLAPNLTENIFAVGAGDRLVGVTTFCNYPEAAKSIAKVGDTMTPNMESIVALKPDVVFVSTASQIETFTRTLADNGIAVFVTNPDSLDSMVKNLRQLGEIFGTSGVADKLAGDLQRRVESVAAATGGQPRVRAFVQISREPLFTIGKQSFMTAIVEKAGGVSATADVETAYPKLSKETASALNPDVLILSDSEDNKEPNEAFKNSGFNAETAENAEKID
jgi:ABC-type Fe3+-hydroxamate transport system substrate-binding protein